VETNEDRRLMGRALRLGAKGLGWTTPNPAVGALVVSNGEVVGEGWHKKAGEPHAEVEALSAAGGKARGGTLYVTLEPCDHQGRTPPCTRAIVAARVKRVVVGTRDPNRKVNGAGIRRLRKEGIEVVEGVCEAEALRLIEGYAKRTITGLPFVTLKSAVSLDGKISTRTGESQWISSERSLREVHRIRNRVDAVMVGSGTVLIDDPSLTTRLVPRPRRDPARVIVDSLLRTPLKAKVFNRESLAPTIVFTTTFALPEKIRAVEERGATVIPVGQGERRVNLREAVKRLGEMGFGSLMIEGGPELAAGAIEAGLADRIILFVAPKLIGGLSAPGFVGGEGIERLADAWRLDGMKVKAIGPDLMIEAGVSRR
jgi:diaminohydroxyphosphoribosylaminopyrimidine deaminase/5-amino-6-(5-phosphoribosylamino)uracil reductase